MSIFEAPNLYFPWVRVVIGVKEKITFNHFYKFRKIPRIKLIY
jgi:hypothetical protein